MGSSPPSYPSGPSRWQFSSWRKKTLSRQVARRIAKEPKKQLSKTRKSMKFRRIREIEENRERKSSWRKKIIITTVAAWKEKKHRSCKFIEGKDKTKEINKSRKKRKKICSCGKEKAWTMPLFLFLFSSFDFFFLLLANVCWLPPSLFFFWVLMCWI